MKQYTKHIPEWFEAVRLGNRFIGQMHNILEERKGKIFSIQHKKVTQKDCELERGRVLIGFNFRTYFDLWPGLYTYLCEDDEYIMSDTPTEIFTNVEFVSHAHGDILIAGLGLGIMLKMLQELPRVKSVTVVEKETEIIQLVEDQLNLPENFKIVEEDIFHYTPDKKYDVIYFDIWSDISGDALSEVEFLEKRFKEFLTPGEKSWCGSWTQEA